MVDSRDFPCDRIHIKNIYSTIDSSDSLEIFHVVEFPYIVYFSLFFKI